MPLMDDKIYQKNPDFVQREVAGECILVPIKRNLSDSNHLFVLNEVGARIWKLMDGTASLAAISDKLLEELDVPRETLEKDITSLVKDLESIQAIR